MSQTIAVIGAGISGLAAAHRLQRNGYRVIIFEKDSALGGRMATRHFGGFDFDHGAQYFTARGPTFRKSIQAWRMDGHVTEWFDDGFVGTPDMTAPAHALADGLVVLFNYQASRLQRNDQGWSLLPVNGSQRQTNAGGFSAVILAVPAPQAAALAASAELKITELDAIRYAPCWALMMAFSAPRVLPDDRIQSDDNMIAWIARNTSKPGRNKDRETVVLHATPSWSERHLEMNHEEVANRLIARVRSLTSVQDQPLFSIAHRWRYALVEQTLGRTHLWNADDGLGACGDWCLGPRVEAAFDSGNALAEAILQSGIRSNLI